eukprot:1367088-Amphidinium_carterae.2
MDSDARSHLWTLLEVVVRERVAFEAALHAGSSRELLRAQGVQPAAEGHEAFLCLGPSGA